MKHCNQVDKFLILLLPLPNRLYLHLPFFHLHFHRRLRGTFCLLHLLRRDEPENLRATVADDLHVNRRQLLPRQRTYPVDVPRQPHSQQGRGHPGARHVRHGFGDSSLLRAD